MYVTFKKSEIALNIKINNQFHFMSMRNMLKVHFFWFIFTLLVMKIEKIPQVIGKLCTMYVLFATRKNNEIKIFFTI